MASRIKRGTSRGLTVFAAAGLSLALAACGSSSSSGTSGTSSGTKSSIPSASADTSIKVPDAYKSKGTLTVATDPPYAPNEFFAADNKTIIGMDVDMINALGQVLGLKMKVVQAGFNSIIPGLTSKKYDLAISSITDSKVREKTVDLVTYLNAGTSLLVKKSNPDKLSTDNADSLCGKNIAAEEGTVQADDITARSKNCVAAGKKGIVPKIYPDQGAVNLALSSGRADGSLADSPVNAYAAKQSNGQFEVTGASYANAPYGIAMAKPSGLSDPVLAAIKKLMADGTYKSILAKWGLTDGATTDPKINGATS